jgi:hypothetical protein
MATTQPEECRAAALTGRVKKPREVVRSQVRSAGGGVDVEAPDVIAGRCVVGFHQHVVGAVAGADEGIEQQERAAGEALAGGVAEGDGGTVLGDGDAAQPVLIVLLPDEPGHAERRRDGDAGHLLDAAVGYGARVRDGVGPGVAADRGTEQDGVIPPEHGGGSDGLRQLRDRECHRRRRIVRIVVRQLDRPGSHLVSLGVEHHD